MSLVHTWSYDSVVTSQNEPDQTGKCTRICLNCVKQVRCEPKSHMISVIYSLSTSFPYESDIWPLLSWILALREKYTICFTYIMLLVSLLYVRISFAHISHMHICFSLALQSHMTSSHVLSKSLLTQSAWWCFYDTGLYLRVNLRTNWPGYQPAKSIHESIGRFSIWHTFFLFFF